MTYKLSHLSPEMCTNPRWVHELLCHVGLPSLCINYSSIESGLKRRIYSGATKEITVNFVDREPSEIPLLVEWACWLIDDMRRVCEEKPLAPNAVQSVRHFDASDYLSAFACLDATWGMWNEGYSWSSEGKRSHYLVSGDYVPSGAYAKLNATFGNIAAAFGLANTDACIDAWINNDPRSALAHAHAAGLSVGFAKETDQVDTAIFFESAGQSVRAAERARLRHQEHYALKADAFKYYDEHRGDFRSNEAAAAAIVRVVPVAHRTALKWIADWKQLPK